jgi:hypothetical protein
MRFLLCLIVLTISVSVSRGDATSDILPYFAPKAEISISDAVQKFNERASLNPIGKMQPPLTKEEVIAAIRGWMVKEHSGSEVFLKRLQTIARTGIIPKGCYLDFIPGWVSGGYDYKVWWVDLFVGSEKSGERVQGIIGYNYRLRAQMISSEPHHDSPEYIQEEKVLRDALEKMKTAPGQ